MSKSSYSKDLTSEQLDVLDKAALLVINARNEAAAMLARAGVARPPEDHIYGSPCMAMADEVHRCGCRNYKGDGCPCLTLTTTDPAFPPTRACGHRPHEHLET